MKEDVFATMCCVNHAAWNANCLQSSQSVSQSLHKYVELNKQMHRFKFCDFLCLAFLVDPV